MRKAVITGAGGFIGRNLTKRLLQEDIQVYGIDIEAAHERILADTGVTPLCVDIGDKRELANILKAAQPDVFYHLAWAGVSTDVKNEVGMQVSNIPLALTVLESCVEAGCKHVIIPGSASEYAYCGQTIDGQNTPAPGDAYAASKAAAQVLCQWYARQHGLNLNWLLIGSIYGPGRNDSNILTYTIKALLRGEEPQYTSRHHKGLYDTAGGAVSFGAPRQAGWGVPRRLRAGAAPGGVYPADPGEDRARRAFGNRRAPL